MKALIAYDGTSFYGWQIQKDLPTIQSNIQGVLQDICRKPVEVTAAGRTDSGVHAFEQAAHFDWEHTLESQKLILAMNGLLPPSIRILSLEETDHRFHARFDARSKVYLYRIDRNRIANPFSYLYSMQFSFPLNPDFLQACGKAIEGEHDFVAFQATGSDVVTTIRNVFSVEIRSSGGNLPEPFAKSPCENLLYVRIHANGFLRKMVRFLVGTILEIGAGRRDPRDLSQALETGQRRYVGVPVPARGLFLEKVHY
jgi:tRNA pseudouridine38-40 synthase